MGGVRKDGILQVSEEGGAGAPVNITDPIGPNAKDDSVSVTLATDEDPIDVVVNALPSITATDTLSFNGDFIDVLIPDGYNVVIALLSADALWAGGGVQFQESTGGTFNSSVGGINLSTRQYSTFQTLFALTSPAIYSIPVVSGMTLRFTTSGYAAGTATVTYVLSNSIPLQYPLTNEELRAFDIDVAVASMLGDFSGIDLGFDDIAAPVLGVFGIGSFNLVYDAGSGNWDRLRGSGGILQATIGQGTQAILADNTANPSISGLSSFGMNFDGATWDRIRGDSVNGLLVNLGLNNDITITGPLGQQLMAASIPVVIASDQNLIATEFNQGIQIGQLTSIESELLTLNSKINILGQNTMALSTPVVLPSDQSPINVNVLTAPSSASAATAVESEDDAEYTEGSPEPLTQTLEGFLRTLIGGLVSSDAESYVPGKVKPLSMTPQGRLRVSTFESLDNKFVFGKNPWEGVNESVFLESPWETS